MHVYACIFMHFNIKTCGNGSQSHEHTTCVCALKTYTSTTVIATLKFANAVAKPATINSIACIYPAYSYHVLTM